MKEAKSGGTLAGTPRTVSAAGCTMPLGAVRFDLRQFQPVTGGRVLERCPGPTKDRTLRRYGRRLLHCGISVPLMSALGHQQTTDLMSPGGGCPLYPRERQTAESVGMSALCQKQTNAPQQITSIRSRRLRARAALVALLGQAPSRSAD